MKKIFSVVMAACAAVSAFALTACGGNTAEGGDKLTKSNLSSLKGKTVGVVQLENVPGLTLQVVLKKNNIDYQIIESVQAEKAKDKVNLVAIEASSVNPAFGCDYYLCSEPAATARVNGTKDNPVSLVPAGSLQEIYGGKAGYPQAVLVAKKSIVGDSLTGELVSAIEGSAQYFASANTADVLSLLASVRTEGLTPAFNENTLNQTVISNCSVWYTAAKDHKATVNSFLEELKGVNANAANAVADEFYYAGDFSAQPATGPRSLYVPDGAPALGIVNALARGLNGIEYHVINSQLIAAQVSGANPAADYCILPVNLASKFLGSGDTYQMLGTVTNGNLYFLTVKNA